MNKNGFMVLRLILCQGLKGERLGCDVFLVLGSQLYFADQESIR